MAERCVRVTVTGRVQGVWFRAWTREQAQRLGLDGWARNEPDGSVAVLLAGPEAAVGTMLEALHRGPEAARVAAVEVRDADQRPEPGFQIRH